MQNNESLNESESRHDLFVLPNGSRLRYRLYGDTGNQYSWIRTRRNSRLLKTYSKKESLPLLGLWNSKSDLYVLCADFDHLPQNFYSFDALFDYLSYRFGTLGIVTRSASEKAKVFFVVQCAIKMTPEIALETLGKLIDDEDVFKMVDTNHSALMQSYLTPSMINKLSEHLSSRPIIQAVIPETIEAVSSMQESHTPIEHENQNPKDLRVYNGEIENLDLISYLNQFPKRESFIRILLESTQLLFDGFSISTPMLERQLGVDQTTVSRWRSDLIRRRWLINLNKGKYIQGKRAKSFIANGPLEMELRRIKGSASKFSEPNQPLPNNIADGTWNHWTFVACLHFSNDRDAYLKWVRSIPGFEKRNRLNRAKRTWDRRFKYRTRKMAVENEANDKTGELTKT